MKIDYYNCKQFINAKEIILGENIEIKEGTFISAIGSQADRVVIGDNVYIDKECVILVPELEIGDYTKIYRHGRLTGYKPMKIGNNCYIDSNVILNSADDLEIGNNVCIGSFSALWTHMKFGDTLEGCRFNYTKKMRIEDDVWFGAGCVVAPIIAEKKSMALAGAIITKDMKENHVYAGVPAVDITDKLGPQFDERSAHEKYKIMLKKLEEFSAENPAAKEFIKIVISPEKNPDEKISYYNVSNRTYTKRKSDIEIKFMKSLLPVIKFVPLEK